MTGTGTPRLSYLCMFKLQYNPVRQMMVKIRELCREDLNNWSKAKVIDADSQTWGHQVTLTVPQEGRVTTKSHLGGEATLSSILFLDQIWWVFRKQ